MPPNESKSRSVVRLLLAIGMIAVGATHLVKPELFARIVPAWLPAPWVLVIVSGFAELAGGVGLLVRRTRRAAGWGLVALYVCVFPANVNMAINNIQPEGTTLPVWVLWARLPLQIVFIALALWVSRPALSAEEARG